ncbi:Ref family recombination enhancement nuclease, partial [Escherichia coli]|uniref:Ref family recombination enhancement nuclease n=2 Tax=Escherichia coli TaxID=562 RepID=UPI00202389B3
KTGSFGPYGCPENLSVRFFPNSAGSPNEVSLHHIAGRTAPGCHKKQLPLCRWHHQHAAPAEVRAKYPWLVPVHADGVVGGKKEFTLLNKSEMELLADAYEMANIMH